MGVITEGEWVRPYDHFGNESLHANFRQAGLTGAHFGQKLSDLVLNTGYIPTFDRADEMIDFDFAQVDPNNLSQRPDGVNIHYPLRLPKPEEIELNIRIGQSQKHFIRGFGSLGVVLGGRERFEASRGEFVFPFRLDLKGAGNESFYGYPAVYVEGEGVDKELYAAYSSWFSRVTRVEGQIYTPITLPDLQQLRFRLTRINPKMAFRAV